MSMGDIDAIAYTRGEPFSDFARLSKESHSHSDIPSGPGMFGCLSVGVHAARAIAVANNKPLVGVHHMVRTLVTGLSSI
jgi:tRNA A37 threonylcarbamoyltransferase TsaD